MPMMGATPAGPGPEAGVYEALAAAVADPKEFAKRLKVLAEETRKHQAARDEAITEQNRAATEINKAKEAHRLADARHKDLDVRLASLESKETQFLKDQDEWARAKSAADEDIGRRSKTLQDWENRVQAKEAAVQGAENDVKAALEAANRAEAEWTARRDRLMVAME